VRSLTVIAILLLYASAAWCDPGKLSVGTYLGLHQPSLEDLNQHEFKSPLAGQADVLVEAGNSQTHALLFPNRLPGLGVGVNAGLEFLWELSDKYDFLVGGSTWEARSRAITSGGFYLQGQTADVVNERTAKLSYNEFYFGLRYNLVRSPKKYRAYYRLTLNEMFDVDYREDLVFLYTSGDAEGIKKSIILQSQATGLLLLQPGVGVDYFINDLVSVGVDASYVVGLRRITLRDGVSKVDFQSTDNVSLWLPQRISPDTGNLQYLHVNPESGDDYSAIRLNFDGWKVSCKLNIYF
jgi:hypothetical protein